MTAPRLPIFLAIALLAANAMAAPLFRQPLPIDVNWVWAYSIGPLESADFNGDGFPDLAYVHPDGRLVIALSEAGGPFAASKITTVIDSIGSMVAGDVNADGDIDLIYRRGYQIGVMLGSGDGTFAAATTGPIALPGPIALGDMSGDGKLDLIAAVGVSAPGQLPELSVHLGDGNGGFGAGTTTSLGFNGYASTVALSDLNGDGRADVIVNGSYIRVFLTGPNGTTLQESWNQIGHDFAIGKLNADNHADLLISNGTAAPYTLSVFLGQGNGTFAANGAQLTLNVLRTFDTSDVDGDGVEDIVVCGDGIAVARGLGNGTFADRRITFVTGAASFVLGDFDRDGKRDIVTNSSDVGLNLNFTKGNGDGTFDEDRAYSVGGLPFGGASSLDMNGDTKPDATTLQLQRDGTLAIAVLRNDGSGQLLAPVLTPIGSTEGAATLLVGMLDGNAIPDAVVITTSGTNRTATSYLGNGSGGFTASSPIAITSDSSMVSLEDVTGDGAADLLVSSEIYEGNGNGTFDAARVSGVMFTVTGDVDGNGTLDAIWRDSSEDRVAIALNTGGGNFGAPVYLGDSLDFPSALGDFNGDDIVDLLCMANEGTSMFLGNGDGTFDNAIRMAIPSLQASAPRVADFNDDGDLDVLLNMTLLLGDGHGRFRSREAGSFSSAVGTTVADFNSDGQPDVLSFAVSVAIVNLLGLVPEPTRASSTTFTLPATLPRHATPTAYKAVTNGTVTPIEGATLFSINGVPVALSEVSLNQSEVSVTSAYAGMSQTLELGTYSMNATYLGSATWLPSSGSRSVMVERGETSLQKNAATSVAYRTPLVVGWTLTAPRAEGMAGPSTTAYTLTENGVALPDLQWAQSSVTVRGLAVGTHTLKLEFTGDEHYKPSSVTFNVTVTKQNPQIIFATVPQARVAGTFTLVARFEEPAYGTVTGSVTFSIGGSPVGTSPIIDNRAALDVTRDAGQYTIGVQYSGDANNNTASLLMPIWVYTPAGTLPVVTATIEGTVARLRWLPSADATHYKVYLRTLYANSWILYGTYFSYNITISAPFGKTRMYAVAPVYSDGTVGPMGPPDIATSVSFANDPVIPGMRIRAAQITELRTAVNAVRAFAGLPAFSFTDAALTKIRALHLTELRTALTEARNAIGMPIAFAPQAPAIGVPVRSTQIEEIRAGIR